MSTSNADAAARVKTLEPALDEAIATVHENITAFEDWYPDDTTTEGQYRPRPAAHGIALGGNRGWTTSFWPGMQWLAYDVTGDGAFRDAAAAHVNSFADRVEGGVDLDTHDLGFLYTLSCVTPWRLLENQRAKQAALLAADHLMNRFLPSAGIIQAWGDLHNPEQRGRTIIDSLMNMPLLYWATEMTGDPTYADSARRHVAQLRDHIIRPDDTTFHTFYWDAETGEPLRGATAQGYSDDSCWARGQAWGIYGFALNYRYTRDRTFLDAALRCAGYFLSHLPPDKVAYWDLVFHEGSEMPRDSSAAAIAACGLHELASLVDDDAVREDFVSAATQMLETLASRYSTFNDAGTCKALIHESVYDFPKSIGVSEGSLWGDYFYLEGLVRLTRSWTPYW